MKPYRIEQGAEADFADALEFYREESEALADRLYDEIHGLIADVCADLATGASGCAEVGLRWLRGVVWRLAP